MLWVLQLQWKKLHSDRIPARGKEKDVTAKTICQGSLEKMLKSVPFTLQEKIKMYNTSFLSLVLIDIQRKSNSNGNERTSRLFDHAQ
jgi:Trk-type K+ transport system membrane component